MTDNNPQKRDLSRFAERLGQLRHGLTQRTPTSLARYTGSIYQTRETATPGFLFPFWQRATTLSFPDFIAYSQDTQLELPAIHQAVILYYFDAADGTPLQGKWISFSELPDGKFYNQAFQGYTGFELTRAFGNDQTGFETTAYALAGKPAEFGSSSFVFKVLPQIPLLVVFWQGDEEFPASFQVLFDASAAHYLPTDGYAILGSNLTRRLIELYKK